MISTLYCVHGWSFDRHFWTPLRAALPDLTFVCTDSGYFGAPETPPLPQEPYLAVGHSAGVLSLLGRDLPGCRGIVSFNGFARFTAGPDNPAGTPPRTLARMQARVRVAPDAVLADFRSLCALEMPWPPTADSGRLAEGLDDLMTADHRARALAWGGRLHWLAGNDDPFPVARQPLSGSGELIEGGHLLPLHVPEYCAAFLSSRLRSRD